MKLYISRPNLEPLAVLIIKKLEASYNAAFIGKFALEDTSSYVFYQPNPDIEKGHSNFFAITREFLTGIGYTGEYVITKADWIFEKRWAAIYNEEDCYISCGVHDYRSTPIGDIDGGSFYCRTASLPSGSKIGMVKLDGHLLGKQRMGAIVKGEELPTVFEIDPNASF